MRRFIIDTDTASDDAVALMMAHAAADISLEAVTIVAGNVTLAQASINARYTLELCNAEVPVYEGCDRPWIREPSTAEWFHGSDGMGNQQYPPPAQAAEAGHAVNALISLINQSPGEITLVTLGPLTNIASALALDPSIADKLAHCFVMGGAACTHGNVTPAAEYNIWCDPEAARRVFTSGIPMTMIGWELSCDQATLDDDELGELRALGTPKAELAVDSNLTALDAVRTLQGQAGLALADPVAMAVALDPSIVTTSQPCHVTIASDDGPTRGMTVVDRLNVSGKTPNVTVCFGIDATRWKAMLTAALM